MNFWTLFLIIMIVYMAAQILLMKKGAQHGRYLNNMLQNFSDEEKFFEAAEDAMNNEKDPEYLEKAKIMKAWGEVFYDRIEDYKKTIDSVNLQTLVSNGKRSRVAENEDAFFYLYLIIQNHLYGKGRMDLLKDLQNMLKTVDAPMQDMLILAMNQANTKFYYKEDDLGEAFYQSVLEGDYGQYKYSKQLIGIYKSMVSAMLAAVYKEKGEDAKYDAMKEELEFFTDMPLGQRWIQELGLPLPKKEDDPAVEENGEAVADTEKEEGFMDKLDEACEAETQAEIKDSEQLAEDLSESIEKTSDMIDAVADKEAEIKEITEKAIPESMVKSEDDAVVTAAVEKAEGLMDKMDEALEAGTEAEIQENIQMADDLSETLEKASGMIDAVVDKEQEVKELTEKAIPETMVKSADPEVLDKAVKTAEEMADSIKDAAHSAADETKSEVSEMAKDAGKSTEAVLDKTADVLDAVADKVTDAADQALDAAAETAEAVKEAVEKAIGDDKK